MPPDTPAAPIPFRDEVRRKLVHLSSLWMVVALALLPRGFGFAFFAVLALTSLLVERGYALGIRPVVRLYDLFFGGMLRRKPTRDQWIVSGGPYVFAAAALCIGLFPPAIAAAALATMLLGDTAAALVGRRFGRHRAPNGKSYEGVAAFLIVGFAGAALTLAGCGAPAGSYLLAAIGVFPAAAVELFEKQLRIDDNFSIPLAMGLVLSIPI